MQVERGKGDVLPRSVLRGEEETKGARRKKKQNLKQNAVSVFKIAHSRNENSESRFWKEETVTLFLWIIRQC